MELIYSFTVALFLTIALIPFFIRFSERLQLVDIPVGGRKIHDRAVPRSGGLAIVLGVLLPLLFLLPFEGMFKGLLAGAGIIVVFGYLDDRYELNYRWKFFGQILAVTVALSDGIGIDRMPFMGLEAASGWVAYPLSFIFLLGAINAVNLSDGLDGLAAGTSLLTLALIAVFALIQTDSSIALVALTLIGGLMGFLRYNTYPARIFMGDTGSQFLGFTVACLAILVSQSEHSALSPVMPLLLLGLPILDTLTVMAIRINEGRSPFSPDKNHLHHQIMSLGLKHYQAVAVIYLIQVSLLVSAYLLRFESDLLLLACYVLFAATIIGFLYAGHRRKSEGSITATAAPEDRRNQYLRRMEWLYRYSPAIVECFCAALLILMALSIPEVKGQYSAFALLIAGFNTVAAVLLYKYRSVVARVAGYSASVFAVYIYTESYSGELTFSAINILFLTLVAFLMLAIRMTRREEFRLDNQDLLVLLIVLIVPQLPFKALSENGIDQVCLKLAVLMYAVEFILGRNRTKYKVLTYSSIASLFIIGLTAVYNAF